MKNLSSIQIEALRIIHSDLEFIKRELSPSADDDSLRRSSTVIRQLLIDNGGLLNKASDWLNIKIFVQASPDPLIKNRLSDINFFAAAGADYSGIGISDLIVLNRALKDEELKQRSQLAQRLIKYNINQYLSIPCIIYQNEIFNRTELIKFISNKLGGAHYELDNSKMARMKHLNDAKDQIIIADKKSIYFEFLSIGQTLVRSKYIDKLRKKIKKLIL